MAIKIRRGLDADRLSVVFEEGEVLYTTDTKSFFIGDGVTAGGNQIGGTTTAELLKTEVHNATGATLTAGQVVYLSGNTGNKPNAVLAKADAEATSSKTIGLIITNIANNANGYIATDGLLADLNTSMFAPGDMLWLSDSIAGGVTTIIPDTPNHAVFIGYVVSAHPTQGKILIHIQNGYELNELHDVKITSVANGDGLIYDSTLGYWKNSDTVTTQGNTFNTASKLVQLDASAKLPAVDGSQLTNLPSYSPPNGLLRVASAISTTFQAVTDYLSNASVLFLNSRRVGIGKDTSVTTQSVAVVEVQDTNTSIVLKPNGTGGIIASVPDGTATGGNARGNYAVDLQLVRSNANHVASGAGGFASGGENRATGIYSTAMGNVSVASGNYSLAVGLTSTASGTNSISLGNANTASSNYSTISGGQSNTASTNTHATVVGGQNCTSSGVGSISGGGPYSTASGANSVALGWANVASANYSLALNSNNTANGVGSSAFGYESRAYLDYSQVIASAKISAQGDAQCSTYVTRVVSVLSSGSTTILGVGGGYTPGIPNGNNRAWNVQIDTIAVVTAITGTATGVSVGDTYRETKQLLFKRIGGTSSIVGSVDTIAVKNDTSMATASLTVSAGASQQMALTFTAPTFSGGGSITCRVVSKVSLVEVAY